MSRQGDVYNLIVKHQRRLQKLKELQAIEGRSADPAVLLEIEDIETQLKTLQLELGTLSQPDGDKIRPSSGRPSLWITGGIVALLAIILLVSLAVWAIFLITRRPPATQAGLVASIIELDPKVDIRHQNTDRLGPAVFGMTVQEGDTIFTYTNAAASLVCENGHAYKLEAESTMELDCHDTANTRFIGRLDETLGKQLVSQAEAITLTVASNTTRASRSEQAQLPLLLAPRNTAIAGVRPTFHWQPVPGATGYRLSLNLASGESWSRETGETSLAYPADVPPLPAGDAVVVNLSILDEAAAVDKSLLRVLTEADQAALSQAEAAIRALKLEEAGQGYLLARLYRHYELWSAAVEQLERLAELEATPAAGLRQELGDLYFEMGLYTLAEDNYQAALTASDESQDPLAQAAAYAGLARIAHVFEEAEAALEHLTTAEMLYREAGQVELADQAAAERAALEK